MFKEQIDLERRKGERNADTIRRLFREKVDKIQTLTQENDRLKSLLQLQKNTESN
jgi:cell shape-determining protein MreC